MFSNLIFLKTDPVQVSFFKEKSAWISFYHNDGDQNNDDDVERNHIFDPIISSYRNYKKLWCFEDPYWIEDFMKRGIRQWFDTAA